MIFAQYQHESTGWNGKDCSGPVHLIPMLGTDGVCPVDGRKTLAHQIADARAHAEKLNKHLNKGVRGFIMMSGSKFSNARPISQLITV